MANTNGTGPRTLGANAMPVAPERAAAVGRPLNVEGVVTGQDQVFRQGERLPRRDNVVRQGRRRKHRPKTTDNYEENGRELSVHRTSREPLTAGVCLTDDHRKESRRPI